VEALGSMGSMMGGTSGMSGLGAIIGGGLNVFNNPYDDSVNTLNDILKGYGQYKGEMSGNLSPYMQAGNGAIGTYQNALNQMQDPTKFMNNIMGQYQQSPWAKFQTQQGINAANNAGSASGMLGSGAEQKELADYAQNISSRDMQQYFNNAMGINNQYLGGYGHLMDNGLNANSIYGGFLGNLMNSQAGVGKSLASAQSYQGQNENAGIGSMLGGLGSLAMGAAMFL
jgi:hypothetical protein